MREEVGEARSHSIVAWRGCGGLVGVRQSGRKWVTCVRVGSGGVSRVVLHSVCGEYCSA